MEERLAAGGPAVPGLVGLISLLSLFYGLVVFISCCCHSTGQQKWKDLLLFRNFSPWFRSLCFAAEMLLNVMAERSRESRGVVMAMRKQESRDQCSSKLA